MAEKSKIINMVDSTIKNLVEELRPPVELRDQVDYSYNFEDNTLEIFEVRPHFLEKAKLVTIPIIKAKFVKTRNKWNIYWMRASGKWEKYEPYPQALTLEEIFKVLKEDSYGCFFG